MSKARETLKALGWKLTLLYRVHRAAITASQNNSRNYIERALHIYRIYKAHGFMPEETLYLGLLEFKGDIANSFISKNRMRARQKFLNPPSFQDLLDDKAIFYSLCAQWDIPTPALLGTFFQKSAGLQSNGQSVFGEEQWVSFFENCCPDEFVVKPSRGAYGESIQFVDKSDPGFSGVTLYRGLCSDPKYDSFVIQECLRNHPALMELNPKRGLQTCRIITFINKSNEVEVVCGYFKPIVGANRTDNHEIGASGNLLCQIEVDSGKLGASILITPVGPVSVPVHPDTGLEFAGKMFPLWKEACELAKHSALYYLPIRAIGWDVAITPEGAKIIEGNARWDPPKFGELGQHAAFYSDSMK